MATNDVTVRCKLDSMAPLRLPDDSPPGTMSIIPFIPLRACSLLRFQRPSFVPDLFHWESTTSSPYYASGAMITVEDDLIVRAHHRPRYVAEL